MASTVAFGPVRHGVAHARGMSNTGEQTRNSDVFVHCTKNYAKE
ncbi:hypothetical protein SXCC_01754 [Gluconacetobacter sp. SXCC-1]|nr:hypothetical protein SXCC_01754 [Gluconacetobacter sp. SXCC-1]